ncbi:MULTISPECIES: hypothetical protein [unclassified Streptomyces]|uniref:hypothetical protein n=1 Tax=unclassified Streptomyces TaxID=2593676 RepID=UPI002258074C|nr:MULTISPECIES: hypothetical protein [unclassified Streptomyces]MCX5054040.1 hypothetical protein [Streptomyces sp. NBC_00474]
MTDAAGDREQSLVDELVTAVRQLRMSRGDPSSHEITARGLLLDLDVNRDRVLAVLLDVRNSRVSDWNSIRKVLITLLCWDDPDSLPTEQDLEPRHTLWRRADQVKQAERDAEFEAELAAIPQIPSRPPTLPTWVRPVESHARPPETDCVCHAPVHASRRRSSR